jgi:hypothetical protein
MGGSLPDYNAVFIPGRCVHVRTDHTMYAFSNRAGTVVGQDPVRAGHYVVRLDEPATYYRQDGRAEPLLLVIEPGDQLEVILSRPST